MLAMEQTLPVSNSDAAIARILLVSAALGISGLALWMMDLPAKSLLFEPAYPTPPFSVWFLSHRKLLALVPIGSAALSLLLRPSGILASLWSLLVALVFVVALFGAMILAPYGASPGKRMLPPSASDFWEGW